MPLDLSRSRKRHDETEHVIQHHLRTISRVLDFFGYTIDDVINDAAKREHVRRGCLLSYRIARELAEEPWRTEASEKLGEAIGRRLVEQSDLMRRFEEGP